MKPFCSLLLLGIIAYVEAEYHECDKYAADTYKKKLVKNPPPNGENLDCSQHECDKYSANTHETEDSEDDQLDQVISLDSFPLNRLTKNIVTKATPSEIPDSDHYCSAVTFGMWCEAIRHSHLITGIPDSGSEVGADRLVLKTNYVAVTAKGYAVKYELVIKGINSDDYIFKATDDQIKVTKIYPYGEITEKVTKGVSPAIFKRFREEFALFYADDDFALYMTCDALTMWVTYDDKVRTDPSVIAATAEKLGKEVEKLRARVANEKLKAPELEDVSIEMSDAYDRQVLVQK